MLEAFLGRRNASLPKPQKQCIEEIAIDQDDLLDALRCKYRVESVEQVFRCAYAKFYSEDAAKHAAAADRITSDLGEYLRSGELPHYVLYQVKYLNRP